MNTYDVIVLGTGQAVGTIIPELIRKGKRIAVAEENRVGGSCVNWGCTPTKTLVASARAARMVERSSEFGVRTGASETDFARVMERVNAIRDTSSSGMRRWLEQEVDFYSGRASFVDSHTVAVSGRQIRGETIVVHTGAKARFPKVSGIDSIPWLDNRGILDLECLPEHLLVVGGSYVGLEFGQAFRRLGSRVTVFENRDRIIFREDPEVSGMAQNLLEKEGLIFTLNSNILAVGGTEGDLTLDYHQDGKDHEIRGSHILFAVGREPATAGLNLEAAGVETDEQGYIVTDDEGRSSVRHIYALGDVNGKGAFTHTSVHDGQVFLDSYLRGGGRKISDRIPVYSMYIDPPLARVGLNASEASRRGLKFRVGSMPMSSVSRAKEKAETGGIMQVVVDGASDRILGATIFGVGGDEIIGMLALAMQAELPYTKLQETVLPHPTVAELVPWIFTNLKDGS